MIEESDKLWLLGMFMNISGSVMVNFGTNLMKSAHNLALEDNESEETEEANAKSFSSPTIWKIGMSIFVIGSLVNFASFAFAAQSLLAALGTVQFISNVFFAKFILKEELTPRIIMATTVIIVGLIMAITFSNHSTQLYTTQDFIDMYTPEYLLFMTFVVVLLLMSHAAYMVYTVNEDVGSPLPGNHLIRPVTYAMVSATVGTQSVLQSKCLAELIKATFEGENQFNKLFVYVIIAIFALGLSFWLYRMNAALKKFDGLLIIPLLQVFWTTSAIVQGGVYFQEFVKFTRAQTIGFSIGVIIVFIGVYFLTPQPREDELLPTDSSHSSSTSEVYQQKHRLGQSHHHRHGEGEMIDMSTRSMIGLTYMPVLIETLPSRHHKHKGSSHHGMDSSLSQTKSNDIELQTANNQIHAVNPQSIPQRAEKRTTPPSE
jgi:magnesium transporter